MNVYQKVLVGLIITIVLLVIVTTMTGHFYLVAVAFTKALDGMSLAALTAVVFFVVAAAEVVGVNTTMLALAVGYIYGRRYNSVAYATMVRRRYECVGGGGFTGWSQSRLPKRGCWQDGSPFVSHWGFFFRTNLNLQGGEPRVVLCGLRRLHVCVRFGDDVFGGVGHGAAAQEQTV
jgi:hypothetical protein